MLHVTPLSIRAHVFYLLGSAFACFFLSLAGLLMWRSMPFFRPNVPGQPRSHGYTAMGISGLILFFTFGGSAIALMVECTHYFLRRAFYPYHAGCEWSLYKYGALAAHFAMGLFFLLAGLLSFIAWAANPAKCAFLFCINPEKHPPVYQHRGASFNAVLSVIFFVTLIPLGLLMWYRVVALYVMQRATKKVNTGELSTDSSCTGTPTVTAVCETEDRHHDDIFVTEAVMNGTDAGKKNAGNADAQNATVEPPTPTTSPTSPCPYTFTNLTKKPPSMRLFKDERRMKKLARLLGLCVGIIACAIISFWMPNDPRKLSASGISNYIRLGISTTTRNATLTIPDMPYAWFRTGQIRLGANLVLKLFPGNVFFYVYLLSVAVIVFLLRQTQNGRYWMQRRIPRCPCFTFGEAAFVVATVWLCVFFFIYWLRDHNYKNAWSKSNHKLKVEPAERWGRGLGQLAILFLSLLLLPIGRQSVVVTVLGVSRDSLLWFHRAVGYAMLAATLAHIIAFYVSYHEYGLLWANLNKIPNIVGRKGVFDDYTVVAATWTTWFLLVAMGIFGLNAVRRRYYELFYYTHLAATYMTLPMMVFHAAAGWMYMLPGATIFLADQLVRVWQRSAVVQVVHARTISDDTVELAFTVPGHWDMRRVHPGQYVLICVPELTALQWHPFTLTNVVDDQVDDSDLGSGNGDRDSHSHSHRHSHGCLPAGVAVSTAGTVFYLHIKSMGPLTWTGRLYDLVSTGQTFSMGVEGPCGTPVDYTHYDDIVLVAGGIGAAPCISVYGSLLRSYLRSIDGAGVPRVRLLWSTRSASLVGAVADMLQLPLAYRNLVQSPQPITARPPTCMHASSWTKKQKDCVKLELIPGCKNVEDAFACDIYVTRAGEVEKFTAVTHQSSVTLEAPSGNAGFSSTERRNVSHREEERERLPVMALPTSAAHAALSPTVQSDAANRGGRVQVHEHRLNVGHEITAVFTNPATGLVHGDLKRKLVLVCGPEGLVTDTVKACATLGVVVHTEEFLF